MGFYKFSQAKQHPSRATAMNKALACCLLMLAVGVTGESLGQAPTRPIDFTFTGQISLANRHPEVQYAQVSCHLCNTPACGTPQTLGNQIASGNSDRIPLTGQPEPFVGGFSVGVCVNEGGPITYTTVPADVNCYQGGDPKDAKSYSCELRLWGPKDGFVVGWTVDYNAQVPWANLDVTTGQVRQLSGPIP